MDRLAKRIQNTIRWRARLTIENIRSIYNGVRVSKLGKQVEHAEVDPRITYPCYKSMDEYIDSERLKSLDEYIKERVKAYLEAGHGEYFRTGNHRKRILAPARSGSLLIPLSTPKTTFEYLDLNNPEKWKPSKFADDFTELMDFIDTLPFKGTARMMIIADQKGRAVSAHRDHPEIDLLHEFIWFRTNLEKPFYMQDWRSNRKLYIESHSAWFDSVNQYHGSEKTGKLAISIRVDGHFSDELKARIPTPKCNLASTAALWACLSS